MNFDSKIPKTKNKQIPVYLNVYNFWSCFNRFCQICGIGVYHTGIQLYDDQYMYFGFDGDETGVGYIQPYTASYQFAQQILLGYTTYTFSQFDQKVLDSLRLQFIGNRYDLLANNCNHFSQRLAKQLQLNEKFPAKINRITDCCNLFRSCIPNCILNGRLDWFDWDNDEKGNQQNQYQQLLSIKVQSKQQISLVYVKNKRIQTSTQIKQKQIVQVRKHVGVRKQIWSHTEKIKQETKHLELDSQDKRMAEQSSRVSVLKPYPNETVSVNVNKSSRFESNDS